MKKNKLDVIAYVNDSLIEKAENYTVPKRKKARFAWVAAAACLCFIIAVYAKMNPPTETGEMGGSLGGPLNESILDGDKKCPIIPYTVPENYPVSSLYYLSKPLNDDIRKFIEEDRSIKMYEEMKKVKVNPDVAMAPFFLSKEEEMSSYLLPVMKDGRIIDFIHIVQSSDGKIAWLYTESDAALLNALSVYTSESSPLSVVAYGGIGYYVIGNKAYKHDGFLMMGITELPMIDYGKTDASVHVIELR